MLHEVSASVAVRLLVKSMVKSVRVPSESLQSVACVGSVNASSGNVANARNA